MAPTPAAAGGQLEMDYTAYGKPHVFRVWVNQFANDPGIGTFDTPGTPVSLDALATELTAIIGPLYNAGAGLAFGAWRGNLITNPLTGSTVPAVEGTITPGTWTANASANVPAAVSQATMSFRDTLSHLVKHVLIGAVYAAPTRFVYSSLSGGYLAYANYMLATIRVVGRAGYPISSLIDMTFDTNDGLTRRYRR